MWYAMLCSIFFLSNTNKSLFYYWIEVRKSSIQLWNLTFVQGDFWDWNLNWAPRTPHTEKANVTPLVPTPPITSCWWILCFSDYAHPPPLSSLLDCSWNWSIAHLGKLICILLTTHLSSLNSWAILMIIACWVIMYSRCMWRHHTYLSSLLTNNYRMSIARASQYNVKLDCLRKSTVEWWHKHAKFELWTFCFNFLTPVIFKPESCLALLIFVITV